MPDADWDLELHREIAKIDIDSGNLRDANAALYASRHPLALDYEVVRDLPYGLDELQTVDLHLPAAPSDRLRPVFCYVHGGGFDSGDKVQPGRPYYDNVPRWARSRGFVGVNVNYRLAPGAPYPAGAEDLAAMMRWLIGHVGHYGGDPASVVVMGHSAGGSHLGSFIASNELLSSLEHPPAGAILSSGVYEPALMPGLYDAYFGDDPEVRRGCSSIAGICETEIPLLVSTAQFDPPKTQEQTLVLLDAFFARHGRFPMMVQADGHNHLSVVYQIGTDQTWFSKRLERFVVLATTKD